MKKKMNLKWIGIAIAMLVIGAVIGSQMFPKTPETGVVIEKDGSSYKATMYGCDFIENNPEPGKFAFDLGGTSVITKTDALYRLATHLELNKDFICP